MLQRTVRKKEDSVVPWVTQYTDDKDVPYVLLPGKLKLALFFSSHITENTGQTWKTLT